MDRPAAWWVQPYSFGEPGEAWTQREREDAIELAGAMIVSDRASYVTVRADGPTSHMWSVTLDRETHDVRVEHYQSGRRVGVHHLHPERLTA